MEILRAWAMPNKNTFSIKPIRELIDSVIATHKFPAIIDPFCNISPYNVIAITNDIDPDILADYHLDAIDFLRDITSDSVDIVLFDPPYSSRQVSESYKSVGGSVNMETTQGSYWGKLKKEISRVVKIGGHCVTCGWNSNGIGSVNGFSIETILLVAHGGWHNDTIITVERCTDKKPEGFDFNGH